MDAPKESGSPDSIGSGNGRRRQSNVMIWSSKSYLKTDQPIGYTERTVDVSPNVPNICAQKTSHHKQLVCPTYHNPEEVRPRAKCRMDGRRSNLNVDENNQTDIKLGRPEFILVRYLPIIAPFHR